MNTQETKIPVDLLPQLDTLLMIVCDKSGFTIDQITSGWRKKEVVDARRAYISIAIKYCRFLKKELHRTAYHRPPALVHIGKVLGNRNHSSIHNLYGKDGEIANHCLKYDRSFDRLHTAIEVEVTKGYKARHAYEI